MARFFKFTPEMAEFLREHLTHSEWKLWSYFVTLDPFGNKYIELPPLVTILMKCGISERTFYRAIAKFKETELFDFQYDKAYIRNLNGSDKDGSETVMGDSDSDKDGSKTVMGDNLSIYKEVQTFSDSPEGESENFQESIPEPPIAVGVVTEISQDCLVKPIDPGEDKFSEARTVSVPGKNVQQRSFNWLPDGPWNINGKLDANFRDFVANDWLKRFGGDIHAQRANVLSHFKKDPANLPIRWEQYQGETLHRYQNTQILMNNGVEIPEDYQDRLINNQRALTQSLPQELNPIASLPIVEPITRGIVESVEPVTAIASLPSVEPITRGIVESVETVIAPNIVPKTAITPVAGVDLVKNEDGQVFKVFKAPAPVDEPITPEQWEETRAKIAAFTGNFNFGKSSPRENSPSKGVTEDTNTAIALEIEARKQRNLDELNQWIADPILRSEAMKKVMLSDCYKCLFTEEGTPYQVIYCEEF
jgi:hypothetical protein